MRTVIEEYRCDGCGAVVPRPPPDANVPHYPAILTLLGPRPRVLNAIDWEDGADVEAVIELCGACRELVQHVLAALQAPGARVAAIQVLSVPPQSPLTAGAWVHATNRPPAQPLAGSNPLGVTTRAVPQVLPEAEALALLPAVARCFQVPAVLGVLRLFAAPSGHSLITISTGGPHV